MKTKLLAFLLILFMLTPTAYALSVFNSSEKESTNISNNLTSYTFEMHGATYSVYYNSDILKEHEIKHGINEMFYINAILEKGTSSEYKYYIVGNNLSNIKIEKQKSESLNYLGKTMNDYYDKYLSNTEYQRLIHNKNNYNLSLFVDKILKKNLGHIYFIDSNKSDISLLKQNMLTSLSDYEDNLEIYDQIISEENKNELSQSLSQLFINSKIKVRKIINNNKEFLQSNISKYAHLEGNTISIIEENYNQKIIELNNDINAQKLLVNYELTLTEKENIENNFTNNTNASINSILTLALNNAGVNYPYILPQSEKDYFNLFLTKYKANIVNELNEKKELLLLSATDTLNPDYTPTSNTINETVNGDGTIDVDISSEINSYDGNNYNGVINTDSYSGTLTTTVNNGIFLINDIESSVIEKVKTNNDLVLSVNKNIERINKSIENIQKEPILNETILNGNLSFSNILNNDVFPELTNVQNSTETFVTIEKENIDTEGESVENILEKDMRNFGKSLLNNKMINENTLLPISIKILSAPNYISSVTNKKDSFVESIIERTQINNRTNEEGLDAISFSYNPSPSKIKDNGGKNIGISLGSKNIYYLDDSLNNFKFKLSANENHNLKIKTFNANTSGIKLFLLDGLGGQSQVIISGKKTIKTKGGIQSFFEEYKSEQDDIPALYVNQTIIK